MTGVVPPWITLRQIYAAALPFIGLELAVLALLVIFPALATWLPQIGTSP
ncbi:MAG: hypothetical protein ACTSX7_19465 [Alphaproteobacteria bacterium]